MRRLILPLLVLLALPVALEAQVTCQPQRPVENRASAYDSTVIMVNGERALICYGRPAARGRTMIGGEAVPFGKLWRTGANEPTTLHIPFDATIAGVKVEPGAYSIYTVPGEKEWEVVVNRSTSQWGHESRYTDAVKAQEVGRGKVSSGALPEHMEVFTIRSAPVSGGADLILEWEKTRVAIPIRAAAPTRVTK